MNPNHNSDNNNHHHNNTNEIGMTAEEWFQSGSRVLFDPVTKRIVSKSQRPETVQVFERVVAPVQPCAQTRWLTMMPGFPDGSYTYAKIDGMLQTAPRLYIEFVGMGDSDTPSNYEYNVMERADLIEAQWKAHKVRRTVLVCFACSSMVMMELLQRQTERLALGLPLRTRIEHVLSINGSYFADSYTPMLLHKYCIIRNTVRLPRILCRL